MKTTYKNFEISSKVIAFGVNFPGDKENKTYHNKFRITVKNTETGDKVSFDFYGSHNDYVKGVQELSNDDQLNTFECLLSDAISGKMDFEDFCSEFGYDEDSRSAHRTWKACKKQAEKAEKVLGEQDIYDTINELSETINN